MKKETLNILHLRMIMKCKRILEFIELDLFQILSSTWYKFPHKAYIYMIQCIKGYIILTRDMIFDVASQFLICIGHQ